MTEEVPTIMKVREMPMVKRVASNYGEGVDEGTD